MDKNALKQNVALVLFGFIIGVVLLEGVLRLGGAIFLSIHEYKNRALLKEKNAYRILCLGESTTALGGRDSYPYQLQNILNQRKSDKKVIVINKGMAGIDTGTIVSQLHNNIKLYNPDMVIVMMGINDTGIIVPYGYLYTEKVPYLIKSSRMFKLAQLLWLNIINKMRKTHGVERRGDVNWDRVHEKIESGLEYLKLGKSYMEKGDYDKAGKIFKKVIEMNPENYHLYSALGWWYLHHGKYSRAMELFTKVIELKSDESDAYYGLALCYMRTDKSDKVLELFEKAIALAPSNYNIHVDLGGYYMSKQRFDKAIEIYRELINVNPDNSTIYFCLGWCYFTQKEYEKGIEAFKRALQLDPQKTMNEVYAILIDNYDELVKYRVTDDIIEKVRKIKGYYNPKTRYNYLRFKDIVTKRGIKLVCVQYPILNVESLRKMFIDPEGIIFVDNEKSFKEAVKLEGYNEYFRDRLAGVFGHCSRKGNSLLAQNIADAIEIVLVGR